MEEDPGDFDDEIYDSVPEELKEYAQQAEEEGQEEEGDIYDIPSGKAPMEYSDNANMIAAAEKQ